jgi:hypothetical protein
LESDFIAKLAAFFRTRLESVGISVVIAFLVKP